MLLTGLLGSLLVALCGFVIGRTPPRDWVSRLDPLADVRTWPPGVDAGYALAFVGLGLLTWAWLGLGPLVRGRPDGVTHVRTAVLLWALPLLPTPPLFSGDGWSYVADGLLTGHHLSPYVVPPAALTGPIHEAVNSRWLHAPAPYGPLPMLWGGAAAHLSGNLWLMLYAYRALALVGLFLLMYAVPRFAALAGRDPATASWLAVGSPLVLAHGVAGLHLDLVMVGLMALALLLAATRGWLPAAVVAGAAMAVKLPALFVLVGVVLLSLPGGSPIGRIRRAVGVGAVATGTMVALGVSGGIGVGFLGARRRDCAGGPADAARRPGRGRGRGRRRSGTGHDGGAARPLLVLPVVPADPGLRAAGPGVLEGGGRTDVGSRCRRPDRPELDPSLRAVLRARSDRGGPRHRRAAAERARQAGLARLVEAGTPPRARRRDRWPVRPVT